MGISQCVFGSEYVCLFDCVHVLIIFVTIMDTFSLEDDDFGDLFITQSSSNDNGNTLQEEKDGDTFLGLNQSDFQSPCSSVRSNLNVSETQYSDISDFEDDNNSSGFATRNDR